MVRRFQDHRDPLADVDEEQHIVPTKPIRPAHGVHVQHSEGPGPGYQGNTHHGLNLEHLQSVDEAVLLVGFHI